MNDRVITRVIEILEIAPDFYVPVKKLWLMCQGEGLGLDLDLDDLHRMLMGDERFEFTPGVDHTEGFEDDPEFAEVVAKLEEIYEKEIDVAFDPINGSLLKGVEISPHTLSTSVVEGTFIYPMRSPSMSI